MIKQQRLGDLIHDSIILKPVSSGWETCKCPLCNDYKDRGGFKFEGDTIIYSCFNCGVKSVFEEFSGDLSKHFRRILNSFGIEDSEISSVVNTSFFNKKDSEEKTITLSKLTKVNTTTPTVKLPEKSFPLGHPEFLEYQEKLITYLINRKVDLDKYKFFFSLEPRFKDRIIIPFYRQGKIIYWQARHIDSAEKKRYDNAPVGREAVMFNFDQLNRYTDAPLFITEGVFDAMMVDGISILGSKMSEAKIELLAKTHRRIVFVIDKDPNGRHLAESVLKAGWEIAFAPDGAEDLNNSVSRFGLSWTIYEVMKSIVPAGDAARLAININCG